MQSYCQSWYLLDQWCWKTNYRQGSKVSFKIAQNLIFEIHKFLFFWLLTDSRSFQLAIWWFRISNSRTWELMFVSPEIPYQRTWSVHSCIHSRRNLSKWLALDPYTTRNQSISRILINFKAKCYLISLPYRINELIISKWLELPF